jgi:hypothetical protein
MRKRQMDNSVKLIRMKENMDDRDKWLNERYEKHRK